MVKAQFGQLIRDARIKKSWTQADLARELGYENPQFISLLERNQSKVPLRVLGQLIVLLELSEPEVISSLMTEYQREIMNELSQGKKLAHTPR